MVWGFNYPSDTNYIRLSTHFKKNVLKIKLQTTLCKKSYGDSYAKSHMQRYYFVVLCFCLKVQSGKCWIESETTLTTEQVCFITF
jgi:hypothetical protein